MRRRGAAPRAPPRPSHSPIATAARRLERIERLNETLLSGKVNSLLHGYSDGQSISFSQISRLTTQGWALWTYWKTLDDIEMAAINEKTPPPAGGVVKAALSAAADRFGLDIKTVRGWRDDYELNEGKFSPDGRGTWARELLCNEEDVSSEFQRWLRESARKELLSVDAAWSYLNNTLLPSLDASLLQEYHISLPISRETTRFWMLQCGAVAGKFQQSYYNDNHQSAAVIKDRQTRYSRAIPRNSSP